ncbi:UDP-N-acetylglucosamine pyrophosphorylase [Elasticomyces elasticus]|nr:UDP-N-acetylglucosamine pyrophosphorylase [Elasticomyces elasticus]
MDSIKSTMNSMMSAMNMGGQTDSEPQLQPPHDNDLKELREKYEKAGQGHVFSYWDDLKPAEKGALFQQLQIFDPEHINTIADRAINPPKAESEDQTPTLEQLPDSATTSTIDSKQGDLEEWHEEGLKLISENKVGVVLMAGGQGTRLGSSAPKGCYDIGLPSKKSLFQLQAERIRRLQHMAAKHHSKEEVDVVVPWYIMTSGPTRKPTEEYFEEHHYFGLDRNNVKIFEQGVLPCITMDGKILLETKAPDGNGGLYNALISSGVVQDMEKRGVQHIHMFGVDNCLVRVADPTFIGFSASKDVDIATKVVRKRDAKESVGLIVQKNGKPDVVEYSEIDSSTAEAKDPKDSSLLKFRAANIVNHYYSFRYLQSIPDWAHKLPHHVAKKKIPSIPLDSKTGEQEKPDKPNGIKLEQFVFDCFPFVKMDKFACMEVKREDEFSALKNAPGSKEDSPETSRKDILGQGRRFLEGAGATVVSEGGEEEGGVEVSPLISYAGEGLEFLKGREIKAPAVIEKEK